MAEIDLSGKGAGSIEQKWDRLAEDFDLHHAPGVVFLALAFDQGLDDQFANLTPEERDSLLEPYREMDSELVGLHPDEITEKVEEFVADGRL